MPTYQTPHVGQIGDRPRRDVSYAFANLETITGAVLTEADLYTEDNPPDPNDCFACPSCGGKMFWVRGVKSNHPGIDRGNPFFRHGANGVVEHTLNEQKTAVYDLVQFLYKRAKDRHLNPTLEGSGSKELVLTLHHRRQGGEEVTLPLVLFPYPGQITYDNPDAVVITSTTVRAPTRKRLTLRTKATADNERGVPLSAAEIRDYITSGRVNDLYVSGFYSKNTSTDNGRRGQPVFVPQPIRLTEAIRLMLKGDVTWVSGVDEIPFHKFKTGGRFALVDKADLADVRPMLFEAKPRITRREAGEAIKDRYDLVGSLDATVVKGTSGKYRYGRGFVLRVFPDSNSKVIVNPSGADLTLSRDMPEEAFRDTLVLYIGDDAVTRKMRQGFYEKLSQCFTQEQLEEMNCRIRVTTIGRSMGMVEDFLQHDLQARAVLQQEHPGPVQRTLPFGPSASSKAS